MSSSGDIFNQVRAAVDIVEVIGEHIALKRAGREFKGLCPFHPDHRPSMAVVPHKQIFHCFVCGTGGDVFKFVKEFHKMGNGEALRMLAQRAGIKLPELPKTGKWAGGGSDKDKNGLTPRERIANTNEWACGFFEKMLRAPQGKPGLDYLHGRGLGDDTIAQFRLGSAPDGWSNLVNAAMRAGISSEQLVEAGLIKQRADSSPYDAFRNRVIFPIIDATGGAGNKGRVIAFGGRVLEEKRDEAGNVVEAKYLNSPDSKLFNKSESLYGLNLARQQIIRTRTAVVVEGYMDVIACHQAGVSNVIATLGTALTPDHARILKNYAQTIVLMFDSDDAGRRAADRALEIFVRGTLDIKLASVPDGKDPCDYCIKNGPAGGEMFQKLVNQAIDALAYKWNKVSTELHATDSISAQQEAATEFMRFVAPVVASMTDPVRRGLLISRLAGLVRMRHEDVLLTLQKLAEQSRNPYRPPPTAAPAASASQSSTLAGVDGSPAIGDAADFAADASQTATVQHINIHELKGLEAAEGWLLGALLVQPALYGALRNDLMLHLFRRFQSLAAILLENCDNHPDLEQLTLAEVTTLLEELPDGAELVRQALELEQKTADWLEPGNLSPNHAKLLQHLTADRGLTLHSLAQDSLHELRAARGADPAVEAEFSAGAAEAPANESVPADPESAALQDALKQIAQIQSRNTTGGNRRVTG